VDGDLAARDEVLKLETGHSGEPACASESQLLLLEKQDSNLLSQLLFGHASGLKNVLGNDLTHLCVSSLSLRARRGGFKEPVGNPSRVLADSRGLRPLVPSSDVLPQRAKGRFGSQRFAASEELGG